jgi:splicing factor 3B subunit 2
MGKLDIDYQVLHDAFFKYQTKPNLSGLGELYYEGKEFEARVSLTVAFLQLITCSMTLP